MYTPEPLVYALEHFGQAVANNEDHTVYGGKVGAFGAGERLAALEDEKLLQLECLVQSESGQVKLVVVKLLHNLYQVSHADA